MWETFVVMIFGLPAFLWQVITKEEKRTLFDDLVLAIMIAIVIYILARIL
ncbi:MAG TPA: hypothetical protein VJB09_01600 [Candidatus Paceibacterota bacterium]